MGAPPTGYETNPIARRGYMHETSLVPEVDLAWALVSCPDLGSSPSSSGELEGEEPRSGHEIKRATRGVSEYVISLPEGTAFNPGTGTGTGTVPYR